jgi:hypothetical protein
VTSGRASMDRRSGNDAKAGVVIDRTSSADAATRRRMTSMHVLQTLSGKKSWSLRAAHVQQQGAVHMVRLTTSDSGKSHSSVLVPREKRGLMWLRGTVQPSPGPVVTASPSTRTIKKFFVTIFIRRRRTKVTDDDGRKTRARRIRLCRVGDSVMQSTKASWRLWAPRPA